MAHLWKDPKGETVLEPSSYVDQNVSYLPGKSFTKTEVTDHNDDVAVLKQRLSELEKKLAEVQWLCYDKYLIFKFM